MVASGSGAERTDRTSEDHHSAVEAALADALAKAAAAGRWEIVAQLAGELGARRKRGES